MVQIEEVQRWPMPSRPVESWIEQQVVEYAIKLGMTTLKLNVSGRIGWPDRIFLFRGHTFFIEFKREGEAPRAAQRYVHGIIAAQGFEVFVIDDVKQGKELIDAEIRLQRVCP
jgi:hypothetical protein